VHRFSSLKRNPPLSSTFREKSQKMVANLILRVNVVEARGLGREDEVRLFLAYEVLLYLCFAIDKCSEPLCECMLWWNKTKNGYDQKGCKSRMALFF
jgi:hypothetical protein